MDNLYVNQLTVEANKDLYSMLQRIGACENEFKNTAHGISYDEFLLWLKEQDDWSRGENLPIGYVKQTILLLYKDKIVIGIGKIRHQLTEESRKQGGNIGYAIDPLYRGNGYATIFLKLIIEKADRMGVAEKLLSVEKYNPASKRVIEKAGGKYLYENEERCFFEFN